MNQNPETDDLAYQLRYAAALDTAEESLFSFVWAFWNLIDPARPFLPAWHVRAICDELEAFFSRKTEDRVLVVNIPPGMSKSLVCSALFPAWVWLQNPAERIITISNDPTVVSRDADKQRQIMLLPEYQALIDKQQAKGLPRWNLRKDQDARVSFGNTYGGYRLSRAVHSAVTGHRADLMIIDDPHDVEDLRGTPERVAHRMMEVCRLYNDKHSSRLDPQRGIVVLIMQRLHPDDLAGELIRQGAKVLCLPQRFEAKHDHAYPLDPRQEGDFLFPKLFGEKNWENVKKGGGAMERIISQHQQRPELMAGGVWKRSHFQHYSLPPIEQAKKCEQLLLSVDGSFRASANASYAAIQVWGRIKVNRYLIGQYRSQADMVGLIRMFTSAVLAWPTAKVKLIEQKANGEGLYSLFKDKTQGIIPINPRSSKYMRAKLCQPEFEAGNVFVPLARYAPWVEEYIDELCAFPKAEKNDQVDATSQALNYWEGSTLDPVSDIERHFGFLGKMTP